MYSKRRLETVAATDPAIADLIAKQMDLQEGPVFSVLDDGHSVIVDDTHTEERWPKWASTAAAMGFRSTMAVRLFTSDRTMGTLNLYDSHADHFSQRTCRWPTCSLAMPRSRCHGFRTKTISGEQSTHASSLAKRRAS